MKKVQCFKEYNYVTPEGVTISNENFQTEQEAKEFFAKWKKRFEKQGYYLSLNGKINLENLDDYIKLETFEMSLIVSVQEKKTLWSKLKAFFKNGKN